MGEKENYETAREARRDVVAHPERPSRHEDGLVRYLSGVAYRETHEHHTTEPAPRNLPSAEPAER